MIFEPATRSRTRAFTLLEVLLAVVLCVGLFFVVLSFYRTTAEVRAKADREVTRIAAVRLVMQRLTTELQTVQWQLSNGRPLTGDSNTLEFVRTTLPRTDEWTGGDLGRVRQANTDLLRVKYRGPATNGVAMFREEHPFVTERESEEAVTNLGLIDEEQGKLPPVLSREIRFVRFRYRAGRDWFDLWQSNTPPVAVEVTLGNEQLPEDVEFEDYPFEIFRRVIHVPAATAAQGFAGNASTNEFDELLMEEAL
jgi:type II secretory pathway pseudopilin PulG